MPKKRYLEDFRKLIGEKVKCRILVKGKWQEVCGTLKDTSKRGISLTVTGKKGRDTRTYNRKTRVGCIQPVQ